MPGKAKAMRWVGAGVAILMVWQCGATRTSYTAICARCLQHIRGSETTIFDVALRRNEKPVRGHGGLMSPDLFSPPISNLDPRLYQEITGEPCRHDYKRGGGCRSRMGVTACGSYSEGARFQFRNSLVAGVYEAYLRTSDQEIARVTFRLIDEKVPTTMPAATEERHYYDRQFGYEAPTDPMFVLEDGLGVVTTSAEWRELLDCARNGRGFKLSGDPAALISRLKDKSAIVRTRALQRLVTLDKPEGWKAIAGSLVDPELRDPAIRAIIGRRELEYWPQVLQCALRPEMAEDILEGRLPFEKAVTDSLWILEDVELKALHAMRDRNTELICLAQIYKGCRYELHEEVLRVLNKGRIPGANAVFATLICGPNPYHMMGDIGTSDPITWLFKNADPGDAAAKQIVHLAKEGLPQSWDKIKTLGDQWRKEHEHRWNVGLCSTAFIQAMHLCDAPRTREWLSSQLRDGLRKESKGISTNVGTILLAIGALSEPVFLPLLEEVRAASQPDQFKNVSYRGCYEYAVHHCRRMQDWKLLLADDGTYSVQKPPMN